MVRPKPVADVAIVGAGAAGLAAAQRLTNAGRTVVVIDARDRVGGRVFTVRDPATHAPIELGGELVHGEAKATLAMARGQRIPALHIPDPGRR